jgi:plastocyanin
MNISARNVHALTVSLSSRQPLSTLSKLTIATLLCSAVACDLIQVSINQDGGSALFLVAGVLWLCAALIPLGLRWLPLLGALMHIGLMIAFTRQPFVPYHLTQPQVSFFRFALTVLLIVLAPIGIGASIIATVQNYQQRGSHIPHWFSSAMIGMAGIMLGALLIGAINAPAMSQSTMTGTTYTNGVPTVHLGIDSFLQSSVTISKGSKLLLVDDGAYHHILFNGTGAGGQGNEAGAPHVNNLSINGSQIEIGPFATAGTYHLYCSLHTGMVLTIIVQ